MKKHLNLFDMKEDYVSFEVAKLLKEKGYNEPSEYYYRKGDNKFTYTALVLRNSIETAYILECTAHPLAEVAKWLREVHNIYVCPRIIFESDIYREYSGENTCDNYMYWLYIIYKIDDIPNNIDYPEPKGEYGTYEEALNEGIKEALNYIIL